MCFNIKTETEYQCAYSFHNDLVKIRFTVAGLYLAAVGIVISEIADVQSRASATDTIRYISGAMALLALVLYIIEVRTRFLYRTIGKRLAHLEERLVGTEDREEDEAESANRGDGVEYDRLSMAMSRLPSFYFWYCREKGERAKGTCFLQNPFAYAEGRWKSMIRHLDEVGPHSLVISYSTAFSLLYLGSLVGWLYLVWHHG